MNPTAPPTRRWTRYLLWALLGLLVVVLLYALITGLLAWRQVRLLEEDARELSALDLDSLDKVSPRLTSISQRLKRIESMLAPHLEIAPHLGWVPRYGPTLVEAPELLRHGRRLVYVADTTWAISEPAMTALAQDPEASPLALLAERVDQQSDTLVGNLAQVEQSCAYLASLDAATLHPRIGGPLERLQPLLHLAPTAYEGLMLLPDLLERDDQNWLLLAQNNEELRPSGGFITSVGMLEIHDGLPALRDFRDSYQVENWDQPHPDPPLPLREYMRLDLWVTRDANWWPDFPTSALAVSELYFVNQGVAVDGVIAADMIAAERLLEALTPLTLANGATIEPGGVHEAFASAWSLPTDALILPAAPITATQDYEHIDIELRYVRQKGTAGFDAVSLRDERGDELISNGGFETGADNDRLPDGWEIVNGADGVTLSSQAPFEGQRCLQVDGDPERATVARQRIERSGETGDLFQVAAMARTDWPRSDDPGYDLTVTFVGEADTHETRLAYPVLAHDWASAGSGVVVGDWWRHRKDIINHALAAALGRVLQEPGSVDWPRMATVAADLLAERHVQLYAKDALQQAYLVDAGWSGALEPADDDFMMLVDANLGYNKVTSVVEQSLRYEVDLTAMPPEARLIVSYVNNSEPVDGPCDKFAGQVYVPTYEAISQGCYWDYVRLYVPQGAEIIEVTGSDVPYETYDENDRTVCAAYLELAPGESRQLVFSYQLPQALITDDVYDLHVQRQAGTRDWPLQVTITAPDGAMPDTVDGPELTATTDGWTASTDLRLDRRFRLHLP